MAISKKKLIELLTERDCYEETDEVLVNEFITNIRMMDAAKRDIIDRGNLTYTDKAKTLTNINPSIIVYGKCLKNIMDISRKFGFTPKDRSELKMEIGDGSDPTL